MYLKLSFDSEAARLTEYEKGRDRSIEFGYGITVVLSLFEPVTRWFRGVRPPVRIWYRAAWRIKHVPVELSERAMTLPMIRTTVRFTRTDYSGGRSVVPVFQTDLKSTTNSGKRVDIERQRPGDRAATRGLSSRRGGSKSEPARRSSDVSEQRDVPTQPSECWWLKTAYLNPDPLAYSA